MSSDLDELRLDADEIHRVIGEAEYVGEGANKGPSTVTPTTKTVNPFKFHKTLRFTEEVLWADEDHQLGIVQDILDRIGEVRG